MGVVTWKNIAPSNPAGILSAANQAAKAMGEGFSGVGTALQEGVDKKVQSETDSFVAELMGLETQAERDAMIADAETAWLNIDTINKTNYELGAPQREMDMFNEQLAAQTVVDQAAAKLAHERKLVEIGEQNKYKTTSSKSTKQGSSGNVWGASPTGKDGFFVATHGYDDTFFGSGSGYDNDDDIHFDKSRNLLLGNNYARASNVSAEEINQLANDSVIRFVDQLTAFGHADTFVFQSIDGKELELDDSPESQEALIDLIYYHYRRDPNSPNTPGISPRMESQNEYFKIFRDNNPQYVEDNGLDAARDMFAKIYERNIKGDNRQVFNKTRGQEIFKLLPTDSKELEKLTTEVTEGAYSASTYIDDVESQESRSATIANDIKGLTRPELEKLKDTLTQKKYASSTTGYLNKDDAELLRQVTEQLANEKSISNASTIAASI